MGALHEFGAGVNGASPLVRFDANDVRAGQDFHINLVVRREVPV
jgi:hypothetical protein